MLPGKRDALINFSDRGVDQLKRVYAMPAFVGECFLQLRLGGLQTAAGGLHVWLIGNRSGETGDSQQEEDKKERFRFHDLRLLYRFSARESFTKARLNYYRRRV